MPCDAAAVKRHAQIAERKVQRMALQVVNKKCMARHAQPFASETDNLSRLKVMHKKGAAYRVKAVVAEGKRQSVSADSRVRVAQVCGSAVHNHRL